MEDKDIMNTNEKALALHEEWNGKITTEPKCHVRTREDLALAYTPGVAEPCKKICQKQRRCLSLHDQIQYDRCCF